MRLLKRLLGDREPPASPAAPVPYPLMSPEARYIHEAFWILLGRQVSDVEMRDQIRELHRRRGAGLSPSGDLVGGVPQGLRGVEGRTQLVRTTPTAKPPSARSVRTTGSSTAPTSCCSGGRPIRTGAQHYVAALAAGETRSSLLGTLVRSEEFERRYRDLSPDELIRAARHAAVRAREPGQVGQPGVDDAAARSQGHLAGQGVDASKGLRVHAARLRPRAAGPPSARTRAS